jgi:PAS domain S-box-containing protein
MFDGEKKENNIENEILKTQHTLCNLLAKTDNLEVGLKYCLRACLQVSRMDSGGIYLFNSDDSLELIVWEGLKEEFVNSIKFHDNESRNVDYVKKGKPIYTLAKQLDSIFNESQKKEGLKTLATIPLFENKRIIGCLNIASHKKEIFQHSTKLAIETIASQAGNIIARLQTAKALRESEEHLKSLMLNAENYVVYRLAACDNIKHKLQVVFVSPSIIDIMGVNDPNEFGTWFSNIHPDDRERMEKANLKAFETKRFDEEFRVYHPKKNEYRWLHSISRGIFDEKGETKFVNGIMIDITKRKIYEQEIIEKEIELRNKQIELKALNTTLQYMLKKREDDKSKLEKDILYNTKKLIFPKIKKIQSTNDKNEIKTYCNLIETYLLNVTSSFSNDLSSEYFGLTPTEIRIAFLIREGKKTKEIAQIEDISYKTAEVHRSNIRKKLGLKHKKANLRTYLMILEKSMKIKTFMPNY